MRQKILKLILYFFIASYILHTLPFHFFFALLILHARGAKDRNIAIVLFVSQFLINLTWSPVFFGQHKIGTAFFIILAMIGTAIATTFVFGRVRKAAAWLMVPYLVWISFAAILNFQIDRLNPDAETLYVPAATSQIGKGS